MASSKVLISLPQGLCREVDGFARSHGMTRSELVRRALKQYLALSHRLELRAELKRGYADMARLNQQLAEAALPLDGEALALYEQSLRSVNGDD